MTSRWSFFRSTHDLRFISSAHTTLCWQLQPFVCVFSYTYTYLSTEKDGEPKTPYLWPSVLIIHLYLDIGVTWPSNESHHAHTCYKILMVHAAVMSNFRFEEDESVQAMTNKLAVLYISVGK